MGGSGSGSGGGGVGDETDPPSTELVGEAAEAKGLWLAALRATVSTVRCSSRFVPAFVQDFESAGGYETVGYMVRKSSIDRLPAMLEQVGGGSWAGRRGGTRILIFSSHPTFFFVGRRAMLL